MPLALSTCWCSHRHTDGYAMLTEIADLGFEYVELSHGIRVTLVPGILRAVAEGVVKVSSTHNFCPLPTPVTRAAPNLFQPSASRAQERELWLRHSRRSLEFAAEVKAAVVVCHLGSVPQGWLAPDWRVRRYLRRRPAAAAGDPRYAALLAAALRRVRGRMEDAERWMLEGAMQLAADAQRLGVRLGIENREGFSELPLDADFATVLARLGPAAGYWHDTGHARLKERLGLLEHRRHLAALAPQLLGFHLHDVSASGRDHEAPGQGDIDFAAVAEFWSPRHWLTLELSPRVPVEQLRAAKAMIDRLVG